jgi:hypothetical protein
MRGRVVFLLIWCKIAPDGTYTFQGTPLRFGYAIRKQALVNIEPILEGSGGFFEMGLNVVIEVISVCWEQQVSVVINRSDFSFNIGALYSLSTDCVVAVDDDISDSPNQMPFVPYARQKRSGP